MSFLCWLINDAVFVFEYKAKSIYVMFSLLEAFTVPKKDTKLKEGDQ